MAEPKKKRKPKGADVMPNLGASEAKAAGAILNAKPAPLEYDAEPADYAKAGKAAPAGEPAPFVPPPNFKPPQELESSWNDGLTEKWLALNEKQQLFLKTWYTNKFKAGPAYSHAYGQANMDIAYVCGSQLLGNPKIVAFREAIWAAQIPPFEKMAQIENAILDMDEQTDPKAHKIRMMQLDAVYKMRQFHKLLPAKEVRHTHEGEVKHDHTVDVTGLEDLFNAGPQAELPAPPIRRPKSRTPPTT